MSRITFARPAMPCATKLVVYLGEQVVGTIHHHTRADMRLMPNLLGPWSVNWISGRIDYGDSLAEVRDTALKGPPGN